MKWPNLTKARVSARQALRLHSLWKVKQSKVSRMQEAYSISNTLLACGLCLNVSRETSHRQVLSVAARQIKRSANQIPSHRARPDSSPETRKRHCSFYISRA